MTDSHEPPIDLASHGAGELSVPRVLAARFEVLRWLGEGGMGTVYLARDRKLERRVAVKLLQGGEPDALTRFKQEFRALADISHPNLIVLHELLCHEGSWMFTMDYVEGRDFLSHVSALEGRDAPTLLEVESQRLREVARRSGQLKMRCPVRDYQVLRRVLWQLVDAVRSLHAASKLHLDLKPSNVLVGHNDQVTVLDFGLARDLKQGNLLWTQRMLGTPAYMAPEHAESGRFEPASDWYAVGVMLYEALTGRLPFEGPIAHILMAKTSSDPDPPSVLCREVPPELEALCMALLSRDPKARPSSAAIMEQLGSPDTGTRAWARTTANVTNELFVGRGGVLERLRGQTRHTAAPRIMLLCGSSGVGKTTLAKRFLGQLSDSPRTVVLRAACYEREAMPFKAFDGIVDALVSYLTRLPPLDLGALLPRHAHALTRLFPAFLALSSLPSPRRTDDDDPQLGRARAFAAFAELFARLTDHAEVVLFIDDLHWSDRDSALLLRALFEGPEPVPLLLIGTYRSEEAEHCQLVTELRALCAQNPKIALEEAELGALDPEEAEALATELLAAAGARDGARARHIAAESHGIPLFIHELVRHATRADASPRADVSLAEVLAGRIAALPRGAAELLEVLAVAGGPAPRPVAFRAARTGGQEAALHTLRVAGLVKSRGARHQDLLDTAHDRVRVVVHERLDPHLRAAIHARLVEAYDHEPQPDDERLFMHTLGAGLEARALIHAERAAARAHAVLAFHHASELYRAALDLLSREAPEDRGRRANLLEQLGSALGASGRNLDAAQAYLDAAKIGDPHALPERERRAADQLLRGGDLQAGSALLSRVLERVGVSYPKSPRAALAALTFERARLFARGLSFDEQPPEQQRPEVRELLDALRITLGVYWLVEPVRGALFATMYLRHALDAGLARHILRGLENEAAYVALTGGAKAETRASELYALARGLTQRIGGAGTKSGYLIAEAGFHAIYGRKQKSTEAVLEALKMPSPQSASWEQTYARFHLYQNTLYIGGRAGLADEISALVDDANQRRDRFSAATLLPMLALARMMADDAAGAERALHEMRPLLNRELFGFLELQETIWTALTQLYRGAAADALATYASRYDRYALSGMPRLSTWRTLHSWGRLLAYGGAVAHGIDVPRNLQAAEDAAKDLERERTAWQLPFASVGRAAIFHARSQPGPRDAALARARTQAEELGYHPFAAVYARVAAWIAGDAAGLAQSDARLLELGIASPERWQRTWAPGFG